MIQLCTHIFTHTHTHAMIIVCYPRSPHTYWIHINEAVLLWMQAIIITSDFFWGSRTMVARQLKWVEDPQESANVFSWRWKGWLTGWPHGHIVSRLSSIFRSLFCCHVRTNKSAYLRADTKVTKLDLSPGVHQHIGWLDICRDKLPDRTATQALHCAAIIYQSQHAEKAPLYSPRWRIFRLHRYVRPLTTWRCRYL